MILNIGSGTKPSPESINIDIYRTKTDNFVQADAHFLPFRNETFREIVSTCVLEHLTNILQALQDQRRVLESGGSIHHVTDNAGYLHQHFFKHTHYKERSYKSRGHNDNHVVLFTPFHLENLARIAGFDSAKTAYIRQKPYRKFDIVLSVLRKPELISNRLELIAWKKSREVQ